MTGIVRKLALQNYSLGPPVETFGPNWKVVAIVVALALLFCWPALAVAWDLHDRTAWIVFYALFGIKEASHV